MQPMILAVLLLAVATPAALESSCNADKAAACDELGNRLRSLPQGLQGEGQERLRGRRPGPGSGRGTERRSEHGAFPAGEDVQGGARARLRQPRRGLPAR